MSAEMMPRTSGSLRCKGFIFDKNGTLVDLWSVLYALALAREREITRIAGPDFVGAWKQAVGICDGGRIDAQGPLALARRSDEIAVVAGALYHRGLSWHQGLAKAREAYDAADEIVDDPTFGTKLLPGIEEMLHRLKGTGAKLAVATTDNRQRTQKAFRNLAIGDLFDVILGGDDVQAPKPSPEPVLKACALLGVQPAEVAVVGDSPMDMMMGKAAGVGVCVAVLTGTGTREQFLDTADVILPSAADLELKS